VDKLRAAIPDLALGTGHHRRLPGRDGGGLPETLAVVERVRYDSAFTFVYSPRRGTEAADMADQVPEEVKRERIERLVEVVQRIAAERNAERWDASRRSSWRARAGPSRRFFAGARVATRP
jgi:tRNA-2-methylthio-N6-dimethylallyladenosine synthase